MSLDDDGQDSVIGMVCVDPAAEPTILVLSGKGNGKRSALEDYRVTNRGGKGVKTMQITEKTGHLVGIKSVFEGDQLMVTSKEGIIIRMSLDDIRVMGRATQGVRIIALGAQDEIADLTVVRDTEDSDEEE
jgi:DNA gyrase subunit A